MKLIQLLFNTEVGAKARAFIAAAVGIIVAVIAFLQAVLDVLNILPNWQPIGAVAAMIVGVISYLGRFTRFGGFLAPLPPAPAPLPTAPHDDYPNLPFD